jgi:electron transport complex protein RnfB
MSGDVYERLRERIDQRGVGFQKTTSGVELKLLRRLFSEEEAQMYLHLSWDLETPWQIAKRAQQGTERVAAILKRMAEKGLVFPKRKGETFYYAAAPYAHGILEHQVNRIDKELAQLIEDYLWAEKVQEEPTADRQVVSKYPMRTIPVEAPIKVSQPIAPYEDVKDIIKSQDRIAVAKCFCAVHRSLLEPGCSQPLEVCLLLGFYAEYYVDHAMARWVTQKEALGILELAEEAGLVHQLSDSVDTGAICNCCPNCCFLLRSVKMLPNPAAFVTSNYFAQVDPALCNGCEICVGRCPMDAISITASAVADINLDRCIGCGLCVNGCPTDALMLVSKPEEARQEPTSTGLFMRSSQDIESKIA